MKLALNCTVDYIDDFLSTEEADILYQTLIEQYHLDQSRIIMEAAGKLVTTDSFKILFLTDRLIRENSYPENVHGKAFPWTGIMKKLRERIEKHLDKEFEVAMCLFYPNGNYFAPFHTDQQTSGYKTILPSISLGEVRRFSFKENESSEVYNLDLAHGSLLVMGDHCQNRYMHSLPKNTKYKHGRINITFREPGFK